MFFTCKFYVQNIKTFWLLYVYITVSEGGSRMVATSKKELFGIIVKKLKAVNYCHKDLHLRQCNSPKSARVWQ